MREKLITIECTVEQFEKINSNAKANGMKTGPYLRDLGLAGFKLERRFELAGNTKQLSKPLRSYDVKGSDVDVSEPRTGKASPRPHRRDRAA